MPQLQKERECLVLLAEDDADDRLLFREALNTVRITSTDTIKLIETDNGQTMLDFLQASASLPNLIVLDMNMPGINGSECLKRIRADARLAEIPVVVMSTSANEATISEARDAGATKYAIKPSGFKELTSLVQYICGAQVNDPGTEFILNHVIRNKALR